MVNDQESFLTATDSSYIFQPMIPNKMSGRKLKFYFQETQPQGLYLKEIPPYEVLSEKTLHTLLDNYIPKALHPKKGTDLHYRHDLQFATYF